MTKRYYAARHTHGREFAYPDGWTAYTFETRKERDDFVYESNSDDSCSGYNQRSEAVSRNTARRIAGSNVKEELLDSGGAALIPSETYYNPHYWG